MGTSLLEPEEQIPQIIEDKTPIQQISADYQILSISDLTSEIPKIVENVKEILCLNSDQTTAVLRES